MPKHAHTFHNFTPEEVWKWKWIEEKFDQVLKLYNYEEIRLPILQDYEVVQQGITALMQEKEAKQVAERTINLCQPDEKLSLLSLRPEGTISILHHTARDTSPGMIHRYYYHGPMFRKDKDGGALEFYQLGVELLGSDSLLSENEIISLGMNILRELGLQDVSLKLNSFGCEDCRRKFFSDVNARLEEHKDAYCRDCYEELVANPFANTNCHNETCLHDIQHGPQIADYLCPKCKSNFQRIKKIQANLGHPYRVDKKLFKNFAYYNETVFDFMLVMDGKELTIGGGGRYDYLSAKITGMPIPAVGFFLDLDLIFRIMDSRKLLLARERDFSVYICTQSPDMEMMLLQIAQDIHAQGMITVLSTDNLSTEVELANAKTQRCDIVIIIREDNIREGKLLLYKIAKEEQGYISLNHLSESLEIARKTLIK